MRLFLTAVPLFGCVPQAAPAGAGAPPEPATGPLLNPQLSRKAKHPSVIPGSFFQRDQKFKAHLQSKQKGPALVVVPPRSQGPCE